MSHLDDRTFLMRGGQIKGEQDIYVIEEYLGLGLTAQVYRARQESTGRIVALKVLRGDVSAISRDSFWHEAQVIAEIRGAGVTNVPEVYDRREEGEIQFLVMEYLDREIYKPLDEFLDPLEEQEALEIARQALMVLRALHEDVGRTYTDMQLKNFYWDANDKKLKILDWNHVSTQRKFIQPDEFRSFGIEISDEPTEEEREAAFAALAQRDLARFGAYFYRMLTGKGALEQGETAYALAKRAGDRWERISEWARQIVRRALHPDPASRYSNAREFLNDVEALQAFWQKELDEEQEKQALDDLLDQAKRATVQNPKARQEVDQVAARLDILERRGIAFPFLRRKLKRLTDGISGDWSKGKLYYEGEQYSEAARIWEKEAHAYGQVSLWRWVMLAQTGARVREEFAAVRKSLEQVVKALEKQNWADAEQKWQELKEAQPWIAREDLPVHHLEAEINAALYVQLGDSKASSDDPQEWEEAVQAYETALKHLQTIPYADLLREEYGWSALEDRIKALQIKIRAHRKVQTLRNALDTDFEKGKGEVLASLLAAPGAREVQKLCWDYAKGQSLSAEQALELVDIALLYGHITDAELEGELRELRRGLQITIRRNKLCESCRQEIEAELAVGHWSRVVEIAHACPEEIRTAPKYPDVQQPIRRAWESRLREDDLEAAEQLDAALTALGDTSEARKAALQVLRRKLTDRKLADYRNRIEQAVEDGNWEVLRELVAEVARLGAYAEEGYRRIEQYLRGEFRRYLEELSLEAARQLYEALAVLCDQPDACKDDRQLLWQRWVNKKLEDSLDKIRQAVQDGKWATLRDMVAEVARLEAYAEEGYRRIEQYLRGEFGRYLEEPLLEAAWQLYEALAVLCDQPDACNDDRQSLWQRWVNKKLEDSLDKIRQAVQDGNWEALRELVVEVARLEAYAEEGYRRIEQYLRGEFSRYLEEPSLEAARQLYDALAVLCDQSDACKDDRQSLWQQWVDRKLEDSLDKIRQAVQEGKWERLLELVGDVERLDVRAEAGYRRIEEYLREEFQEYVDRSLLGPAWRLHDALTTLGGKSEVRAEVRAEKLRKLEADIRKHVEALSRLAKAEKHLHDVVALIEKRDALNEAKEDLAQAETALEGVNRASLKQHQERYDQLRKQVQDLREVLSVMQESPSLIETIAEEREKVQEFQEFLKGEDPDPETRREKIRDLVETLIEIRSQFGSAWTQVRAYLPDLAKVEQQVIGWEKRWLLSNTASGLVGATLELGNIAMALDKVQQHVVEGNNLVIDKVKGTAGELKQQVAAGRDLVVSKVKDALGKTQQQITEKLTNVADNVQIWGMLLLALFVVASLWLIPKTTVARLLKNWPTPTVTAIVPTMPPATPTPLPSPTATPLPPTSTPTPTTLRQGVTLRCVDTTQSVPTLTVTMDLGWERYGDGGQSPDLLARDPHGAVWQITPVIRSADGSMTVPVAGSWETVTTTERVEALWRPMPPLQPLPAGEYQFVLKGAMIDNPDVVQESEPVNFTVPPVYGVEMARSRPPFNPGDEVPGMIGYYTITNTGNTIEKIEMFFVGGADVLTVELTITPTNAARGRVITFTPPAGEAPALNPSLLHGITITDVKDIELQSLVSRDAESLPGGVALGPAYTTALPPLPPGGRVEVQCFVHTRGKDSPVEGWFVLIPDIQEKQAEPVVYYDDLLK